MKKLLIFNSLAVFIFLLLFLNIDNLLSYSVSWIVLAALTPVAAGLMSALSQNKNKSYEFLPAILAGSVFFSFVSVFFGKFILYFTSHINTFFFAYINPFSHDGLDITLMLLGAYIAGGLVGIAIRGINLIFLPKQKFKLNLNISFLKSFLLGAIILLVINIYYVSISIPPDGRWKFQIPVTSLFIALYLAVFFFVSKKVVKNPKTNYLLWVYNAFLSLTFITNAEAVQIHFQDVGWQYLRYISTAPYLVIFSLAIICYIPLALYLEKLRKNKIV